LGCSPGAAKAPARRELAGQVIITTVTWHTGLPPADGQTSPRVSRSPARAHRRTRGSAPRQVLGPCFGRGESGSQGTVRQACSQQQTLSVHPHPRLKDLLEAFSIVTPPPKQSQRSTASGGHRPARPRAAGSRRRYGGIWGVPSGTVAICGSKASSSTRNLYTGGVLTCGDFCRARQAQPRGSRGPWPLPQAQHAPAAAHCHAACTARA
jgi:hypothetical protein